MSWEEFCASAWRCNCYHHKELLDNGCGLGTLPLQRWELWDSTGSFIALEALRQHCMGSAFVTTPKAFYTALRQH